MLQTLRLENYRCFRDHTVTFHPSTVIVGKNNAGKSTIVEALHIIAAVVNRNAASFVSPPELLELGKFQRCIAPSITHLDLNLETAFYRYGDPPAILTATFTNGATITGYVHKDGVHASIHNAKGWITKSGAFLNLQIPHVHILPQIAPLQADEERLSDHHVEGNYYTRLASRHFRNQVSRSPEHFAHFKQLAESTWHGLRPWSAAKHSSPESANGHNNSTASRSAQWHSPAPFTPQKSPKKCAPSSTASRKENHFLTKDLLLRSEDDETMTPVIEAARPTPPALYLLCLGSDAHRTSMNELATRLRRDGVDVTLDQ